MSACKSICVLVGAAATAALVAGSFCAIIQHAGVVPLIVDAEAYEGGDNATVAKFVGNNTALKKELAAEAAAMAEESWGPADGAARHLCTWVSDVFIAFAFALTLTGSFFAQNTPVGGVTAVQPVGSPGTVYGLDLEATTRAGATWGAMGFLVFGLAPGLGLTPELPGMLAEELSKRQAWWICTALATAAGLMLLNTKKKKTPAVLLALKLLGVCFILLPHIIGAPHHTKYPDGDANRPPPELGAQFVASALVTQLVFWIFLGVANALTFNLWCDTGVTPLCAEQMELEPKAAATTGV